MSTQDLGQYIPAVRQNGVRLNSNEPIVSAGTNTFSGSNIFSAGITTNGITNTGTSSGSLSNVVNLTATGSVTQAQSGSVITLAPAAATVITLPVTPVVGTEYTFIVITSATGSNTLKIITGSGTQLLQGAITSATTTASVFESVIASSNISVAMNGTTTGGLVGTYLKFTCLSATLWNVFGTNFTSGTTATPFATS